MPTTDPTDPAIPPIALPEDDDHLLRFEREGAPPLPAPALQATLAHAGAHIWFAAYGPETSSTPPVVLLHGGLGHSGNWAFQLPALLAAGHRVLLLDSRGHGRSTRDDQPYSYTLMASDLLALLDHLSIPRAILVGWSDGACTALTLASHAPTRVAAVFFFACNMDPTGLKDLRGPQPVLDRCLSRHALDYARLSPTPDDFKAFVAAVGVMMSTQPNYTPADLADLGLPVTICQSLDDEFILPDHARYLAATLPHANLVLLEGVTHFAPLQRPALFNATLLTFLSSL